MGSRRYQIQAHLTEVRAAQYGQADLVMRGHQGEPARDNMALRAQLVVVREGVLADRRVDHQPRPQVTVAHDAAEVSSGTFWRSERLEDRQKVPLGAG